LEATLKCDLCGKHISSTEVFNYDAVEESKLCSSCYQMVVAENKDDSKTAEPSTPVEPKPHELHQEITISRCTSCSSIIEYESALCPNCGQIKSDVIRTEKERQYVPLFIRIVILAVLILGAVSNPTILFLPLGIPIFFGKICGGSKAIALIVSLFSYGTVLLLLIKILTAYDKNMFTRALIFFCVFLILNFAGCSSMGRFIDG
jgi:predicted RNA-binding Zn-ribbon protein involved in translation (DUF1610 family)